MKKIRILIVLALCIVTGMKAQETAPVTEDSKQKKEINEIKLSEEAVYADVVQMVTDDNEAVTLAQQKSIAMLQTHVIEIFAKRMKMDKKDVQEIWDVIDDKCQNITVRKGDLLRVFTYIAKDALGLGPKKPKKGDVEEWLTPDVDKDTIAMDTTEVKEIMTATANILTEGKDSINYVASVPATKPVSKDTVTQAKPVVAVQTETAIVAETPQTKITEPEPAPVPVVEVKVPALCETLMAQKTYARLMSFLKAEKSQQKLMYGNFDTMQYPEKCYVVVIDKATRVITAVLDKGETDRMNFVTKKNDRYNNYRGGNYAIIFIQEY